MNNELIQKMRETFEFIKADNAKMVQMYKELNGKPGEESKVASILEATKQQRALIDEIKIDRQLYGNAYDTYVKFTSLVDKGYSEYAKEAVQAKKDFKSLEAELLTKYGVELEKKETVSKSLPVSSVPTRKPVKEEEKVPERKTTTPKNSNKGCLSKVLTVAAVAALIYGVLRMGSCAVDIFGPEDKDTEAKEDKEIVQVLEDNSDELGTFTDASDPAQVQERAEQYFQKYFADEYARRGIDTVKEDIQVEDLADIIAVANGEGTLYDEFNPEEINLYTNKMNKMFGAMLSDNTGDSYGFIPHQFLFEANTAQRTAAAQIDEVAEPTIAAMNANDPEAFKKYATEFGKTVLYQFVYDDFDPKYISVKSACSGASQTFLYALVKSEYAPKIMEYGMAHDIDICIPYCTDYTTGEVHDISLSALISMIDYVPTLEYDALLARSGLTSKQVEKFGNKSACDTLTVEMMKNAKNFHYGRIQTETDNKDAKLTLK